MSTFEIVRGVEGDCLVLDGTRICGPKPWGGGRIINTFRTDKTMCDYDTAYREGYDDGYKAASDLYLDECRRLRDCLSAILGAGEAPAHAMDDGRADNRREERTAPSADGIRA